MRITVSGFLILAAASAFAGNNRSVVSLNGDDSNPCTPSQPCRSFTAAIVQTNAGGEIIAVDSAGYGPFTINQSMTVSGAPGVHAGVTATSGIAIHISAGTSDRVLLKNLWVISAGGTNGIYADTAAIVSISDSVVAGFTSFGIPSNVGLIVDRCQIMNNDLGINVFGGTVVVSNSEFTGNSVGVAPLGNSSVTVAHCILAKNINGVVSDPGSPGEVTDTILEDCTIVGNSLGVYVEAGGGGTGDIRLSNDVIFGNVTGVKAASGMTIYSYGNNTIDGNSADLDIDTVLTPRAQR